MTTRPATPIDAEPLAKLHIASWQAAYKDDFSSEFLANLDVAARVEWFTRRIEDGSTILVAERAEEVAGFCFVGEARDSDQGELYAIYVDPRYWGQGVGSELLTAAETAMAQRGFTTAHLWVLESNQRARAFYEAHGWELAKPLRMEDIGGRQVTERRYDKALTASRSSG